jgi:hypothetical protein
VSTSSGQSGGPGPPLSFEEFKLYYESTERVTERRLSTNRWNYSVAVAILVAIAGLVKWSSDKPSFLLVGLGGVLILSFVAVIFCTHWLQQIEDFKALNQAKFEVLAEMAPRLTFDAQGSSAGTISYCPFDKEWIKLQNAQVATRIPFLRQIALRSSTPELFIPRAFRALFAGIAAAAILAGILNWSTIAKSPSPFTTTPSSTSTTPTPSTIRTPPTRTR